MLACGAVFGVGVLRVCRGFLLGKGKSLKVGRGWGRGRMFVALCVYGAKLN